LIERRLRVNTGLVVSFAMVDGVFTGRKKQEMTWLINQKFQLIPTVSFSAAVSLSARYCPRSHDRILWWHDGEALEAPSHDDGDPTMA